MRIMYVVKTLATFGGIERVLTDKINYLCDKAGYDVRIVTTDQGRHPLPFQLTDKCQFRDLNIRFTDQYRLSGFKRILDAMKRQRLFEEGLREQISEFKPDILVGLADLYADTITKVNKSVPYVVEAHSSYGHTWMAPKMTWKQKLKRWMYIRHLSKAKVIVTLTDDDAADWKSCCDRVEVIPNIVHLNATGTLAACENKKAIFVGRLSPQKGWHYLLDIWERVVAQRPDWTLHIFGDGEEKQQFEEALKQKGIKNIVRHEPTAEIMKEYLDSSVFLLTSVYEPFGLVIPEAMSCGLPVISFQGQGPESIITDGSDGYIIKAYDCDEYASKLLQLIDNKELRLEMGAKGAEAAQRFAEDKIMPKWTTLFEGLSIDN